MDFYPKSYHTPKHKSTTISNWKKRGVIYHDFDELYQVYINTMECQFCKKEFKNSRDRCLDHDHTSGFFRKIICRNCNNKDCYLKYPLEYTTSQKAKKYKKKWHDEHKVLKNLNDYTTPRVICFFCNKNISKACLTRHYKNGSCLIKPQ